MRVKPIVVGGVILAVLGWLAFMVSFWLPGAIGTALQATALSLGLPGLLAAGGGFIFWREIEDYQPTAKQHPLRCTDCGSKILNAAGSTIGDQIEGELMIHDLKPSLGQHPWDRRKDRDR